MSTRIVETVVSAVREDVGDLHTHQAIAPALRERMDPFLLLAHHGPQVYPPGNRGLPFGPHPHRGFETVTFIRDGLLAHHDSAGHESVIGPGGVQWMTAGSGLIHAEVSPAAFRREGGALEILQLWINLPAAMKFSPPRYVGLQAGAIPMIGLEGGVARLSLVSGQHCGVTGPVETLADVFMSTLELDAGAHITLPAPSGRGILFYVMAGSVELGGRSVGAGQLVTFSDGDAIEVEAVSQAALLFGHADKLAEPIVAGGPFIMNSQAEIDQAFKDFRDGRFDGVPISLELG